MNFPLCMLFANPMPHGPCVNKFWFWCGKLRFNFVHIRSLRKSKRVQIAWIFIFNQLKFFCRNLQKILYCKFDICKNFQNAEKALLVVRSKGIYDLLLTETHFLCYFESIFLRVNGHYELIYDSLPMSHWVLYVIIYDS